MGKRKGGNQERPPTTATPGGITPASPGPTPPTNDPASPPDSPPARVIHREVAFNAYEGPIPSPEQLAAFREIDPQLPSRLVKMAEDTIAHAWQIEREQLASIVEDTRADRAQRCRGQVFGFILGMTGLLSGAAVVMVTRTNAGATAGGAIAGVTLASMVIAFLKGDRAGDVQRQEQTAEPTAPPGKRDD